MGFFDIYNRFLKTSAVANWPDRLNARHEAIIASNKPLFDGARVLDLASHDGRWSFAALDAGAASVGGVEVRPELAAAANRNMAELGVSPDRYRFETGDMFAKKEVFREHFDLVLCLGFFYHTTRHVELLHLIRSTDAPTLILDTALCPLKPINGRFANFIYIGTEDIDFLSNGIEEFGVRGNKIIVAHPTESAVHFMLQHFGYTVQQVNWEALISRLGLITVKNQRMSAQNPVADYDRHERGTFLATLDN